MAVKKSQSFVLVALVLVCVLWSATDCGSGSSSNSSTAGPSYKVTIVAPTTGWGTVTSVPPGISSPPTCSASFPENTQLALTATPTSNHSFNGWTGVCSGSGTCTLTVSAPETAKAIFAPAKNASKVIAYVFTPDSIALKSEEFYLLGNGRLQALSATAQPTVMTSTNYGLVADVPTSGGVSTSALQAYSVAKNGAIHPRGAPANIAMHQWVSLTSDSTYVYAPTDEGMFGFEDQAGGVTPLPSIQLPVPPPAPCTVLQENARECQVTSTLML